MQLALPGFGQPLPAPVFDVIRSTRDCDGSAERRIGEARSAFYAAGIEPLGAGCYSIVVPHPEPDKVIKLNVLAEDGFEQYRQWMQDPEVREEYAPHLPVIHDCFLHDGVRVTVMERLHHLDWNLNHDWRDKIAHVIDALGDPPAGYWNDLHSSNVMQRSDGTIVVTDPWAGGPKADDHDEWDEDHCECSDCCAARGD